MTTQEEIKTFEGWCIVELMGHNVIAGYCSEQVIAGVAMLRVDVPNGDTGWEFTKYFAAASIYGITPTTAEAVKLAASRIKARPVSLYILPETMRPQLARVADPDDDYYDDSGDPDDDEEPPL